MTTNQFINLELGDIVEILSPPQNRGKRGIIRGIHRVIGERGYVYVEPISCEFIFSKDANNIRFENGFAKFFKNEITILKGEKSL
jgi:hypothetical protein